MRKNLFLFVFVPLLFSSCARESSENVNQDSIYSIYELFYNENTDKTMAHATFRFGGPTGTLLQLTEPAESFFNGDQLNYNNLTAIHEKEYPGLINSGTFEYNDLDGNSFTNETPEIVPIDFPAIDTIDSGAAFEFTWDGAPIAENETITLTINGSQQGNIEIFTNSIVGQSSMILPSNRLSNLGLGNAKCFLQRTYNSTTIEEGTNAGGRMAIWYITEQNVEVK